MTKAEERAKFRTRKVWKDFRLKEIEARNCECEICGKKLTHIIGNLHHRYSCPTIEDYMNLSPERFLLLCTSCHDWVHLVSNSPMFKRFGFANLKEGDTAPYARIGEICSRDLLNVRKNQDL